MKYVINNCWGGFSISEECAKELGMPNRYYYDDDDLRADERLIKMVEEDSESVSGPHAKLEVVEIPDNATDWELTEYDGLEEIIAVIDGKIVHL